MSLTAALLFALLTLVPIVPWQATCFEEPVPGPYRPIFVTSVSDWFSRRNVYHWRFGDLLLLRVVPLFDGDEHFDRDGVLLNVTGISDELEDDLTINGTLYPKPPRVRELQEEQRLSGVYDLREVCRAAIQPSPADPPLPR
jgi:hypothetical protein